jgi:hypothetical protein
MKMEERYEKEMKVEWVAVLVKGWSMETSYVL